MKELEAIQISRPPLAPQGNNFSLRNAVISANGRLGGYRFPKALSNQERIQNCSQTSLPFRKKRQSVLSVLVQKCSQTHNIKGFRRKCFLIQLQRQMIIGSEILYVIEKFSQRFYAFMLLCRHNPAQFTPFGVQAGNKAASLNPRCGARNHSLLVFLQQDQSVIKTEPHKNICAQVEEAYTKSVL